MTFARSGALFTSRRLFFVGVGVVVEVFQLSKVDVFVLFIEGIPGVLDICKGLMESGVDDDADDDDTSVGEDDVDVERKGNKGGIIIPCCCCCCNFAKKALIMGGSCADDDNDVDDDDTVLRPVSFVVLSISESPTTVLSSGPSQKDRVSQLFNSSILRYLLHLPSLPLLSLLSHFEGKIPDCRKSLSSQSSKLSGSNAQALDFTLIFIIKVIQGSVERQG